MKKIQIHICCLFLFIFQFTTGDVFAQTVKVTGKVLSSDGKPIELVTVKIKESDVVTVTNATGFFSLDAQSSTVILF